MGDTEQQKHTVLQSVLSNPAFRPELARAQLENDAFELLSQSFYASGLTQSEFGRRIGVSRERARQIIHGDARNLTIGVLGRCAGALNLSWRLSLTDILTAETRFEINGSPVASTFLRALPEPKWISWKDEAASATPGTSSDPSAKSQLRSFRLLPNRSEATNKRWAR